MRNRDKNSFLSAYKSRFAEDEHRRAFIMLWIQAVLLALLGATLITVFLFNDGDRLLIYSLLVVSLFAIIFAALMLNLAGKYRISAWLTVACVVLGPWGSILLDNTVLSGDLLPLVYLVLSIQLCSFLLSELATIIVAVVQTVSLAVVVLTDPNLTRLNWPSLVVFIVFAATLGIVASFTSRRQLEQIRKQRNQLKSDEVQLLALSMRDSLTGLYNRRFMRETLEREVSRVNRKNQSLGIIMADVDDFKKINDTFGHATGDAVLCEIAAILNKQFRKSDIACRFGGDEFIIILPECPLDKARDRAESLRAFITMHSFYFGSESIGEVTLSFGVAAIPDNGANSEEILTAADRALYFAKNEGRNCVKGYN